MHFYNDKNIHIAGIADVDSLVDLLNKAYRGDDSKQGWTTEAHLIGGNVRTDEASVKAVIAQTDSVILIYKDANDAIVACVNLQQHTDKIYLGMFAVSPLLQGAGIGKKLLQAAEEHALKNNCTTIYMTVISVRTELIDWYKRHGYKDTGNRKSFEEDGVSGNHLQVLEFVVLEKQL